MSNQDTDKIARMDTDARPLITFALLTYNQERYVREAVEGAFSQTYSPMEIILSDDGSSDRTFEILQSLAKEYRGPHHVTVQQTPANKGIWAHVLNIVSRSHGKLIVFAAGDDISYPHRVETLYMSWKETGAWGLYSRFDQINELGDIQERNCKRERPGHFLHRYLPDEANLMLIHGATSAYDRKAFTLMDRHDPGPILTEDSLMTFLLNIHGKPIVFVEDSLIRCRTHPQTLSNRPMIQTMEYQEIVDTQKKAEYHSHTFANLNRLFLHLLEEMGPACSKQVNRDEILAQIRFYDMAADWTNAGLMSRLSFLSGSRRRSDIQWILPRLFGITIFSFMRLLLLRARKR